MDTYAVIEVGGKQYRVGKGDSVVVDRLHEKEGAKFSPKALLYRGEKTVFEGADLGKVKVDAVVTEHLRGEKLRIFKYRPKKGYRRRAGHRSELTRLEIKDVKLMTKKPAEKKAEAKAEKKAPAEGSGPADKAEQAKEKREDGS